MKKLLASILASILAASMLVACTQTPPPSSSQPTASSAPAEGETPTESAAATSATDAPAPAGDSANGMVAGELVSRHPLYMAADELKQSFYMLGFQFGDNGEGLEVEKTDTTFATWEEPTDVFGWQNDPILLGDGTIQLRTRILPAQLGVLAQRTPVRLVNFGRVYSKEDGDIPMHSQIEGFVTDEELSFGRWQDFWNQYAVALLGLGAGATLESAGEEAYKITLTAPDGAEIELGYTGPASEQAMQASGAGSGLDGWVFVINVDKFAVQRLSIDDRSAFYENDISVLEQYTSNTASGGYTPAYRVIDALRQLGYLETCGDTIYPDGIYKKMNMIQEEWDTNNQGLALVEPIGEMTALRTVQAPAIEKVLALNFERGATEAFVFEVGHIYSPVADKALPKERLSISIGAYGPDVTMESFTADVEAVLQSMGVSNILLAPTDMAIAYETDSCMLVMNGADGSYLDGNFGQISEIATGNFEIGVPAYMAQLELDAPVAAGQMQMGEITS